MGGKEKDPKLKAGRCPGSSEREESASNILERGETSEPPDSTRRNVDVTEVTNNEQFENGDSTPLLNLVTAASRLLDSREKEEQRYDSKVSKKKAKIVKEQITEEQGREIDPDSGIDEKKAVIKPDVSKNVYGSSIIRGTKEDLMRNPNQKPTFAEQLYDILENEEHHDVLQWMPDGMSFTVVNHKKFTLYKMAKLFNIRNMSSFVRKLGRWGFCRVHEKQSNNSDIFKHPDFKRGERATVKRKVRCLGRLIAAGSAQQEQQQMGMGANNGFVDPFRGTMGASTALRREADFVVPMSNQGPLMEGTMPFHDAPALNESNTVPSMMIEPTLDRVTDASAASAEALYLSHRQFQQAKMERLVRDQQDLNEREMQNLLRQRELQQRELEAQKRRIMLEQQQLQQVALRSAAMSVHDNGNHSSLTSIRRTLPEIQPQDVNRSFPQGNPGGLLRSGALSIDPGPHASALQDYTMATRSSRGATGMDQQGLFEDKHQLQHMMAFQQERRALMDQTQHGLDDSITRSMTGVPSALSRHSFAAGGTPIDTRMISSPNTMLNSDESRAQQRKAVIQALLQEEHEWELKRRGDAAAAVAALDQSQSFHHSNFDHRSSLAADEAWTTAREAQQRQLEQIKVQQQHQQQQQHMMLVQQQQQQLLKQQQAHFA